MRLERAHPQLLGQGERLCIVGGGRCPLDGRLLGCEVTEEPQGPGFAPPFPVRSGKAEGTCGTLAGVVQATSQPIRLAQQGDNAGLLREASPPSGSGLLLECLGLLQQRQGLGQASGERIGIPQVGHHSGEKDVHLAGLADVETLGQQGHGVGEVAAQQVEVARAPQGNG